MIGHEPTEPSRDELVVDDTRTMALTLSGLFAAGAMIVAASLLLPHPASFNETGLWSDVGLAILASSILAAFAGRLPSWSPQVAIAMATVIITGTVHHSHSPASFYSFFYIWAGIYAFFFLGRFWGTIQMAFIGVCFGWALAAGSFTAPVGQWIMVIATVALVGGFVEVRAERLRGTALAAQGRARALAAVNQIAEGIGRSSSPAQVAAGVCAVAAASTEAKGAMICQVAVEGVEMEVTACTDPAVVGRRLAFVGRPSLAVRAFNSRKAIFVGDTSTDPEVEQDLVRRLGVGSMLAQPILRDEASVGVIVVYWDEAMATPSDAMTQTVGLIAVEAALALERAELLERLERAARTDDLSGLPNRRTWGEELQREMTRALRDGNALCVAVIDLDCFKQYNDTNGHQAGDRLLKQAAAAWSEELRDTDVLARHGGDEFALALPDCDLDEALALLERVRAATPESERASAGVVQWDRQETAAELFARADEALYAAKGDGRDRVVAG